MIARADTTEHQPGWTDVATTEHGFGVAASLAALAVCIAMAACRGSDSPLLDPPLDPPVAETWDTGLKVVIVGIDGATYRVIDPLLEAGELPVFRELLAGGARGEMRSETPTRSPALWTTLATGWPRDEHGITDFTLAPAGGGEPVLASARARRRLALWDLMGPLGKSTGFLGWWATWPAEPVAGWLVSDRITRTRWSEWTAGSRDGFVTYPPELAAELRELVVDPLTPPMDEIDRLVELTPDERQELLAAQRPVFAHWLSVFKFAYASQRSYEKMALDLLDRGQPDLTGLFLIATDPISHTFWHFYEPGEFRGVDAEQARRLGRLVPNIYRHNDRFLAALRERLAPDTVLLVVSDHGFRASGKLPQQRPLTELAASFDERRREAERDGTVAIGQSGRHGLNGILIAAGGPIRRDAAPRATLYDLAPTVLALLGLPVPRDLPGRVLTEMIEPAFLERYPVRHIDSYEPLISRARVGDGLSDDDAQALEMLRSLGYVQ